MGVIHASHRRKDEKNYTDITVWSCFGNYDKPSCPRNCTSEVFAECEAVAKAGKSVVIVEETDGEKQNE